MKPLTSSFASLAAALVALPTFCILDSHSANAAEEVSRSPSHGRAAALEDLKQFKTASGLEVKLFASEPMLRNPANMDVDSKGRVWVTEGANYRIWQKWGRLVPEGDRIMILEDTDGDGQADNAKVFYQGNEVNTALGICVLGTKVIVSSSPNVLIFSDENGDDRADGPPQVLFSGIGGTDNDHGVHAFVLTPEGKLAFNFGNAGSQVRASDGSPIIDLEGNEVAAKAKPYRQGMAFRCNLDGSRFETLGWNFRNPYEIAVDSFGTFWQSDNDDDGNMGVRINYVMPHGNFGYTDEVTGAGWNDAWKKAAAKGVPEKDKVIYEWHLTDPGVVPNLLNTGGGSPTGICAYEGDLLPASLRNTLIHCDAGPRVVRSYGVQAQGAGFSATSTEILSSENAWFRPSDVCVGPDGSLFIADWNDAGVGGHNMADQKLETMTGRVYRLAPPNHKAVITKPDVSKPNGAVAALRSPNQATRYLGWSALDTMGTKAEKALARLAKDPNPRMRARALPLLAKLPKTGGRHLDAALKDPTPEVRVAALRCAQNLNQDALPLVTRLAKDSSLQVQRECALLLRGSKSPQAPAIWAQLASQCPAEDRWYLEALGIGADGQWDAFLDAWLKTAGEAACKTPAGQQILWRSRAHKTPALVVGLLKQPGLPAADRDRLFRTLDFCPKAERDAALMQLLTAGAK